ncbi:MAG: ABC transporter ATP-binding protein [Clostridia bacterium]
MSLVEVDKVSLTYHEEDGETPAIEDITLKVEEGEFVSIVGPSGCGKTSLLSILAGINAPDSGAVRINGSAAFEAGSQIGYMLQHDHLLSFRTIYQNTLLGLEVKRMLTAETRAYALSLLSRYGLIDFKDAYPRQLSGGMRQKVALIRTLAFSPALLLLDEPFSSLDYQTRLKLSNEVTEIIRNEGKTAILVTHDISEAISMSERIYVFSKRPALIKNIHEINLGPEHDTIKRRNHLNFKTYFDNIWGELQ